MTFGIEQHIIDEIIAVFEANSKVDKAYVFGSRAKGNFRPDSDIDIAVKGFNLYFDDILKLSSIIAEKNLAINVDLVDYGSIKEPDLKDHIDRIGVEFYSKWKESNLGEFINLKRGYDLPSQNRKAGSIPIFSSSGITDFHHVSMKNGPGVITGRYGTIGKVYYSENPYWPLNTTLYVQDFKGNYPKFVFYFLQSLDFEKYSDKSAVPGINRNDIHKEIVSFPPVLEQIEISLLLSCLDNKIDLLKRQNGTLEQLAESLFRQLFVEEACNEWKEITLANIADHLKENCHPTSNPNKLYHHYSLPAFDNGKEPAIEVGAEILSNKFKVVSNSVLISKLNPRIPRIWLIYGKINEEICISSTEFQIVKPKEEKWIGFVYCFLKSNQVTQELGGSSSGTSGSHQRVNPQDIFNLKFLKPSLNALDTFNETTNHYWKKINSNNDQIHTLVQIRDTLLPKLIRGEVRVKVTSVRLRTFSNS